MKRDLTEKNLLDWLGGQVEQTVFPRLSVVSRRLDLLEKSLKGYHGFSRPSRAIGTDPGCYLFSVSEFPLEAIARQIAHLEAEYSRSDVAEQIPEVENLDSVAVEGDETSQEPSSLIRLTDGRWIPSVGPGGRITIKQRQGTVTGTASVRTFRERQALTVWVQPASILRELADLLDRQLKFYPACGYYERTWMELQDEIEPVFDFIIEDRSRSNYPAKWQITLPATEIVEQ